MYNPHFKDQAVGYMMEEPLPLHTIVDYIPNLLCYSLANFTNHNLVNWPKMHKSL